MDRPTHGQIYGQAPSKVPDVPDVNGMFEAADVPLGDGTNLPHSLEWYAGAADRQKVRDAEVDELVVDRNDLRNEWCNMAREGMADWITKVEELANLQEPQDINSLLARTVAERPDDAGEIEKLKRIVTEAERQRAQLREANAGIIERLRVVEYEIHEKQNADQAEEEVRQEKERLAKEHRARSEEALRKAQELMYGHDPDNAEEDEEGDAGDDNEPGAEAGPGPLPPIQSPGPPRSPDVLGGSGAPGRGPTPPAPSARSGLGRELPPIADPPPPPALG